MGTQLGVGDDAAVLDGTGRMAVSTDLLVEGVHFRLAATNLVDLGHKALAVNLSDLAAMGAEPIGALVGIAAPPGLLERGVEQLYEGLDGLAREHGATIVGGDISSADQLVLAVTAIGVLPGDREPATRDAAEPGDVIAVTGSLGAAAGGLRLLDAPEEVAINPHAPALLRRYHRPEPRLREAQLLVSAGVRAMMDISDGLAIDAARLARRSGVRVEIALDAVPIAHGIDELLGASTRDAAVFAATGGDDYELLAAAPLTRLETAAQWGVELTVIGRVEEGDGDLALTYAGGHVKLDLHGWTHDV